MISFKCFSNGIVNKNHQRLLFTICFQKDDAHFAIHGHCYRVCKLCLKLLGKSTSTIFCQYLTNETVKQVWSMLFPSISWLDNKKMSLVPEGSGTGSMSLLPTRKYFTFSPSEGVVRVVWSTPSPQKKF